MGMGLCIRNGCNSQMHHLIWMSIDVQTQNNCTTVQILMDYTEYHRCIQMQTQDFRAMFFWYKESSIL